MRSLAGWTVPALPLKGGDVVARGIAAGPEVARLLRAVEAAWVAEDFPDAARVRDLLDQKIGPSSDRPQESKAAGPSNRPANRHPRPTFQQTAQRHPPRSVVLTPPAGGPIPPTPPT